jgi:hypothetical protein
MLSSTAVIANQQAYEAHHISRSSIEIPLSLHDALALTQRFSDWQVSSSDRVVLYAMPSECCPALAQYVPQNQAKDDESSHSSRITVILQAAAGRRIDLRDSLRSIEEYENLLSEPESDTFQNIFSAKLDIVKKDYDVYSQRCYWDVDLLPKILTDSHIDTRCCGPEFNGSSENVIFGPLIGAVSHYHAEVLLESSCYGYIELLATDQLTGEHYLCMQYVKANIPKTFTFANLRANHAYDVTILDHDRVVKYPAYNRGTFTTLKLINETVKAKEAKQIDAIIANLQQQVPVTLMDYSSTSASVIEAADHSSVPSEQVIVSRLPSRRYSRSEHPSENIVSRANSRRFDSQTTFSRIMSQRKSAHIPEDGCSVHKSVFHRLSNPLNSISIRPRPSMREPMTIHQRTELQLAEVIAEGNETAALKMSTKERVNDNDTDASKHRRNSSILAIGRIHASLDLHDASNRERAIQCEKLVSELLTNLMIPFNPISEVIHFGSPIDVSMIREDVLSHAAQLEDVLETASRHQQHKQSLEASEMIYNRLVDCIRSGYRLCWHASSLYRSFLAHGSHLFVHDPILDLFEIFDVVDYSGLRRDLSEATILQLASAMQSSFQEVCMIRPERRYLYLGNHQAMVYHLKPNLLSMDKDLISALEHQALHNFLVDSVKTSSVSILIIASPLPLLHPDAAEQIAAETTGCNIHDFYGQLRYSYRDLGVLQLIDEHWLKHGRSAIIVSSGGENFTMKITPKLNDSQTTSGVLHQVVCGPLIGSKASKPRQENPPAELEVKLSTSSYDCSVNYTTAEEPMLAILTASTATAVDPAYPSFTNKLTLTHAVATSIPDYASSIWQQIIRYLNAIDDEISIDPMRKKDEALVEELKDESAWKVLRAVDKIMNDRYIGIFNEVYHHFQAIELLRQSCQLASLYKTIAYLIYECRQQTLPRAIADLLAQPSSMTMHLLWQLHLRMKRSGEDRLVWEQSNSGLGIGELDEHLIAIAAMRQDCESFVRFLRHVVSAQILSEYFATYHK